MAQASQSSDPDPSEQPDAESSQQPNEALKRAREERGWTQEDAAQAIGCSVDAIYRWESGSRHPQKEWRIKICAAYQRTPGELHLLSKRRKKSVLPVQQEVVAETPVMPANACDDEEERDAPIASSIEWERPSRFRQVVDKRRRLLLTNVWAQCINGLLKQLLEYPMLLSVDLGELTTLRDQAPLDGHDLTCLTHDLPTGTPIVQVYDDADGELLIVGESGSGKSVQLLELIRQLLLRAAAHETAPLPVFFPLGSWPEGLTSLDEWLVTGLYETYGLPEKIGRAWLETDQLIILLDGFDEASEEARSACVQALRSYQESHPLASLVICCLTENAPTLTSDVHFRQTVCLKSLSKDQIDLYLTQTGCQREAVQQAFQDDPELQAMCTNLLMLKSVASIYRDEEHATLALSGSIEIRRHHIFEQCIRYRLVHYQEHASYSAEQARYWLSWLAWQMQRHQRQDALYLERMQPSWLATAQQSHRYQRMVSLLIIGVHCVLAGGLVAWLKGGLKQGVMGSGNGILGLFGGGAGNSMLGWMAPGIGGGCEGGASLIIILALMIWLITILVGSPALPVMTPRAFWRGIKSGVQAGLILGVAGTLLTMPLFMLRGGWHYGVFYGLGTGFLLGIVMGLMRGLGDGLRYGQEPVGEQACGTVADHTRDGLVWGLCGSLGFAIVEEILRVNQTSTLLYSVVLFLFFFWAYGFGGGDHLFSSLLTLHIEPAEIVVWSWRHLFQDVRENSLRSLSVALVVSVAASIAIAAASSFFYGPDYGLHYGLVLGVISGLVVSIASFLATMLKSGWSADILSKEHHRRANEGILRSGKNALLGACLFAPLGGIASGFACCLGFGAIGQLATWPTMGMAFGVMMTIIIFIIFVTAHGGIAWVEHYLLRTWLYRTGYIPRNYVTFLDTASAYRLLLKVRGSYRFSHRLFREHFAGVYQQSLQQEPEEQDQGDTSRRQRRHEEVILKQVK